MSEDLLQYIRSKENSSAFVRGLVRGHRRREEAAEEILDVYPNEREAICEALEAVEINEGEAYAPQVAHAMRQGEEENIDGRWGVHDWEALRGQMEASEAKARAALVLAGEL
jgi:hypothetical protein